MPKQANDSEGGSFSETSHCTGGDDSRMVQCDKCDDWYHFDCVGVNQDVENQDWLCPVSQDEQQAKTKVSANPLLPVSTRSTIITPDETPLCTSSDLVASIAVTSSLLYPPNTVYPSIGKNANVSMPPQSLMPPTSFMSPFCFMPLYQSTQINYSMPPIPANSSVSQSNPYAPISKVNMSGQCYTVSSSVTQPIPSAPITGPPKSIPFAQPTVLIEGSNNQLPESLHPNHPPLNQQRAVEDNLSQCSDAASRRFTKQRQLELQLQLLDEERKIQEAEESNRREYLRKRHELLKEMANENASLSDVEEERSSRRVYDWLSASNNTNVHRSRLLPADVNQTQPNDSRQITYQQVGNNGAGFMPNLRSTPRLTPPRENENYLSGKQLAARQAVSRELPIFSGVPEEWPLFYSTFTTSTEMCGYTQEENLIRLMKL
ncbi:histone acetyltransferase p300-like isoform X1 [Wyeomyia smithii]|uniref:histone acetyltransferase p300-like isoform X1 n=1 Tax=Wyeomyia smithii TaxID=174621 RepID=UPI0024680A15|nr:histone acetyltransferase p300-like isoform X1 [Wyeomyia smithii]